MRSTLWFVAVSACLVGCAHQRPQVADEPIPEGRFEFHAYLEGQSMHGTIELVDKVQITGCEPYTESARQLYTRQQQFRKLTVGCDPHSDAHSSPGTFFTLQWTAEGQMHPDVAIAINTTVTRMERRGCIRWSQPPVGQPATCVEYQLIPVQEKQKLAARGSITRVE